jgi:hypothetical protein
MKDQLNSNFTKSSNLILGSVGLGIIIFFSNNYLSNWTMISIEVISSLLIIGLALLIRKGHVWPKYLLIILILLFLIEAPTFIFNEKVNSIIRIIFIAQIALQLWATILLFNFKKIRTINN